MNNQYALYSQATMPSDISPMTQAELDALTAAAPSVFKGRQVLANYNVVSVSQASMLQWTVTPDAVVSLNTSLNDPMRVNQLNMRVIAERCVIASIPVVCLVRARMLRQRTSSTS